MTLTSMKKLLKEMDAASRAGREKEAPAAAAAALAWIKANRANGTPADDLLATSEESIAGQEADERSREP